MVIMLIPSNRGMSMTYCCEMVSGQIQLEWLQPTLRRWGNFIEEYCAVHPEDVPYFYTERANVGTLTAAAWSAGCTALEEYQTEKNDGGGVRKGRADLYVYSPAAKASVGIEAKQAWITPETSVDAMLRVVREANNDAMQSNDADFRAGAVFFTLKIAERGGIGDFIDRTLETMRMLPIQPDLLAWSTPRIRARYRVRDDKKVMHYWPGVILFVRQAKMKL